MTSATKASDTAPRVKPGKADLDAMIDAAERAVIERDQRVRHALRELSGRLHDKAGIGVAAGSAVAVGTIAWRLLRRRRGAPDGKPRGGRGRGWLPALSMLAAVLPADLRRLVPHSSRQFVFGVLPLLGRMLARGRADRGRAESLPATAAAVDLARYCGHWFEIARLPIAAERRCVSDVSADYALTATPGMLAVINRCRYADGRIHARRGVARVVDGEGNARLKLSFAPAALRWLPAAARDYWILQVAPDYTSALVGTPDRSGLWLLSRTPVLAAGDIETLIAHGRREGYPTADLVFTSHRRS